MKKARKSRKFLVDKFSGLDTPNGFGQGHDTIHHDGKLVDTFFNSPLIASINLVLSNKIGHFDRLNFMAGSGSLRDFGHGAKKST